MGKVVQKESLGTNQHLFETNLLGENPYHVRIRINDLPKATNELLGANRFVKHRNAQKWKQLVYLAVNKHLPLKPLKSAHISFIRHSYRFLDYDGLVASAKPVVDGLVTKKVGSVEKGTSKVIWPGVIENDTWTITGKWNVDQVFSPKGLSFVELIVKELKD